eukprot:TRINITY_DN4651_c0_g1_i1.p1 TRINITY_DN4651_c0_g1~~TRINITY_DN4651_c0_g1_i1.p1  ORF type:complete len:210 (-),score=34.90 TRINITY_DN4651_c0_g1_i1:101-730(-)
MRLLLIIFSLSALVHARRWLCDDMTRPRCPDGTLAVYNRPTGNNAKNSKYHPPPTCKGQGKIACADKSKPKPRFNLCARDEKVCNQNKGKCHRVCNDKWPTTRICPDGNTPFLGCCLICDLPFEPCHDGSHPRCPGVNQDCPWEAKRCKTPPRMPRTQCKDHMAPHCPWKTKNRNHHNGISDFNFGDERPGNRGHRWGGAYAGNRPNKG